MKCSCTKIALGRETGIGRPLLFKGNAKGEYLVLLMCLLLFIAAVDTIPDPPAINPPSSPAHRISALYLRGAAPSPERVRPVLLLAPGAAQIERSPFALALGNEFVNVFPLGFVRRAADSSPPDSL